MKNSSVVFPSARKRLVAPVYDERANVLEIEITFQLRRLEPIAIDSGCPLLSGREELRICIFSTRDPICIINQQWTERFPTLSLIFCSHLNRFVIGRTLKAGEWTGLTMSGHALSSENGDSNGGVASCRSFHVLTPPINVGTVVDS